MRSAVYLALALFAGSCWSQVPAKKRVAVFDFENAAVQAAITSSYFQTHAPDIGKGVAELLVSKLVQDAEVTVLERTAIDKVLEEQNLTASDRTDPTAAARLGRLLGVDAIVLGTITHYEYDEKMKGASRFFGDSGSPKRKCDISSKIIISTRLINPDTAEVLGVSEGIGETNRKGVKMDLRDTGGRLVMASGINSPVMNESIDKAVAQLVAQLEPELLKLPPRTQVINGLVADASVSGELILNIGAKNGIQVGDRLQVLRAGKEIRDPLSGKILMRNDTFLGIAVVTKVNDTFSVAHYEGTEPVKVSDMVKALAGQKD
jgi:curli biogenesis system outer membrane secretion channel CsgG